MVARPITPRSRGRPAGHGFLVIGQSPKQRQSILLATSISPWTGPVVILAELAAANSDYRCAVRHGGAAQVEIEPTLPD
jgi:hypothetical protein